MSVPFKNRLQKYIPKSLKNLFDTIEHRQAHKRLLKRHTLKEDDFASLDPELPASQLSIKNYIDNNGGGGGTPGPVGPAGPAGADGADGNDGADGQDGATGVQGAIGPQGPAGIDGSDGAAGPQGNQGVQGTTGATGASGPTGADGATGPQGAAGAQGIQGIQGLAGSDGAAGPQGATGAAGSDGATGAQGATGAACEIETESYDANTGILTLEFSDTTEVITGDLRGADGVNAGSIWDLSFKEQANGNPPPAPGATLGAADFGMRTSALAFITSWSDTVSFVVFSNGGASNSTSNFKYINEFVQYRNAQLVEDNITNNIIIKIVKKDDPAIYKVFKVDSFNYVGFLSNANLNVTEIDSGGTTSLTGLSGSDFTFSFITLPSNRKLIKRISDTTATGRLSRNTTGATIPGTTTTITNKSWYIRKGSTTGPFVASGGNPDDGVDQSGGSWSTTNRHEESVSFTVSESDTYYLTTDASTYPSEIWCCISSVAALGENTGVDISTCVNYSVANVEWAQGHGTAVISTDNIGVDAGDLTNENVGTLAPGTYYFNMYDQYDDTWEDPGDTQGSISSASYTSPDTTEPPVVENFTPITIDSDGTIRKLSMLVYPEIADYRVHYKIKLENEDSASTDVTLFAGDNNLTNASTSGIEDLNYKVIAIAGNSTQVLEGYLDVTSLLISLNSIGRAEIAILAKSEIDKDIKVVSNYPHETWIEPLQIITN